MFTSLFRLLFQPRARFTVGQKVVLVLDPGNFWDGEYVRVVGHKYYPFGEYGTFFEPRSRSDMIYDVQAWDGRLISASERVMRDAATYEQTVWGKK